MKNFNRFTEKVPENTEIQFDEQFITRRPQKKHVYFIQWVNIKFIIPNYLKIKIECLKRSCIR